MKRMFAKIVWLLALVYSTLMVPANAAEPFNLCGGSSATSTYTAMLNDVGRLCPGAKVILVPDTMTAIEWLKKKQCDAAMLQGDIRALYMNADPTMGDGQMLMGGMHLEAYHFIAPEQVRSGLFSKRVATVGDLAGLRVGASRSGAVSMRNYMRLTGMQVEVTEYADVAAVLAAVDKGDVQAGLAVIGAGNASMASVSNALKFLPIPADHMAKLTANGYVVQKISYAGKTTGPIPTVATRALLVQRKLNEGDLKEMLRFHAKCISKNVGTIADYAGSNQAWETVFFGATVSGLPSVKIDN
jgi:TRAP-type uncharacterized transport system substrate-binding protein